MSESLPPTNEVDDELKNALLAAFGDDGIQLLDEVAAEDDEFSSIEQASLDGPAQPDSVDDVLDRIEIAENDPPKIRWIKELSQAIYGSQHANTSGDPRHMMIDRHVVFRIANNQFAVPLNRVREIARLPKVTTLPRTPAWLMGIANFRGQIISITDLQNLLQLDADQTKTREKIVIVHDQHKTTCTALIVDRVIGIRAINNPEQSSAGCPQRIREVAAATAVLNETSTVLIDTDRMFDCIRLNKSLVTQA